MGKQITFTFTTKQRTRMTDNVNTFLMKSARTGNKADPVEVAREMKTLRYEDGELTFKPKEWRTALHRRGIDAEEIPEDIQATESEMAFDTLRSLVMDDMGKPSHPIAMGAISANL